ncbi:hypothetical protein [Bacillus sp. UNC41MFS5]|uniref:hypothetical protein n=1 Tax=Bacillus sp. UNC41MFS5 TaxID=1449046 RepID=UPI001E5D5775|nr:hypothetical protein [Bacillus sp. UNC41MFS5]
MEIEGEFTIEISEKISATLQTVGDVCECMEFFAPLSETKNVINCSDVICYDEKRQC